MSCRDCNVNGGKSVVFIFGHGRGSKLNLYQTGQFNRLQKFNVTMLDFI